MRAGLYIRVSTDEQAEDGYSLEAQERIGRIYAEMREWKIVKVYIDDGYSGRSDRRPGLEAMRQDIRDKKIDAVVVHKLDRMARNLQILLELVTEWDKAGVSFISIVEQMDFSTPMGRVVLQILGAIAEWYVNNLIVEIRKGHTEKVNQGLHNGPVPLGYQRDEQGHLITTADAPTIQLIRDLYLSGKHTYISLADDLNARGITGLDWRTGRRILFTREYIRALLKNKTYAGFVRHGDEWHPGKHEALWTLDEYERIQGIMSERASTQGAPLTPKRPAPLRHILYCQHCRADERAQKLWHGVSGRNGVYRHYVCAGRDLRICETGKIAAAQVEGELFDYVRAWRQIPLDLIPDVEREARSLLPEAAPRKRGMTKDEMAQKRKRLFDMWRRDLMSDADYEEALSLLAREAVEEAETQAAAITVDAGYLRRLITDIPTLLEQATIGELNDVYRALFERVWVFEGHIHGLTPREEVYPMLAMLARGGRLGWLMGFEPTQQPPRSQSPTKFTPDSPIIYLPARYARAYAGALG